MKSSFGSLPAPRWRAEGAPRLPLRPRGGGSARFALMLAGWITCLLAIGALLALLRPMPCVHFVPLSITEYHSPTLTAPITARRDLERLCGLFDSVAARTWTAPDRAAYLERLEDLQNIGPADDCVVYLGGHAALTSAGEVAILPADAVPDDPRTWIPLTDILQRLKRCPARRQLLIVDVMHPGLMPRWGVPAGEIPRALAAALAAAPDDRRLVLGACAAGEESQSSAVLGQSIFAHYLEAGLRGRADGYGPSGRRDGRVTVRELAVFVEARVARWAQQNRGVNQTPQLVGRGADFALAAVADSTVTTPIVNREASPAWLHEARALGSNLLEHGAFRRHPRGWLQMQTLIADAERAWRFGADAESMQAAFHRQFDRLRAALTTPCPSIETLAQDAPPPPGRQTLQDSLAEAHQQWRQARPDEAERIQARFLAQWPLTTRSVSSRDRDGSVVAWLTKHTMAPANIRWADALLRTGPDAEPRYGATLTIRLLADLANRVPASAWSTTLAEQALTLARLAEAPLRHPETFTWIRDDLEQAVQRRHEGEMALWSAGYVPRDRAEQLLRDAELRLLELGQRAESLASTWELVDRASVLLPAYRAVLDLEPQRSETWMNAMRLTTALLDARGQPHAGRGALRSTLDAMERDAGQLHEAMQSLREPFAAERIERLLHASLSASQPQVLRDLEALRDAGAGWLTEPQDRAVQAAIAALAKRLHESTAALDRAEDVKGQYTAAPPDLPADGRQLAARCASVELAMLRLGGVPEQRLASLRDASARLAADPARPKAWLAWGQALRDLHAVGLPEQMARTPALAAKERLSRVLPVREPQAACDAGESLAHQAQRRDAQQAAAWLADHYRYQARDYAGLGLDTPGIQAARRFFADAAATHAPLPAEAAVVLRGPAALERLHAGRLSAMTSFALERIVPTGQMGTTQLQFVAPDTAWLEVTPDAFELPPVKNAGPPQTLATQVPLRVGLRHGVERSQTPAPLGFLAVARCDGRAYHRLVSVPLNVTPEQVAVLISSNPKEPTPSLDEVKLRPGNVRQSFFVYVHNLTPLSRSVLVELSAGGGLVPGGKTRVTLRPGQLERIVFQDAAPPLDAKPLPDVHGPLEVRVLDVEQNLAPLALRRVPIIIHQPRDYVRIADAQVEPLPLEGSGRVSVSLQTSAGVPGPGIPAQLVVPARRLANLPEVSHQRELPPQAKAEPVSLSAETTRAAGADDDQPIYVTVDGVPRALIFRTASSQRQGVPARHDDRLALRIRAAASMPPAQRVPVTIEVDNAPPGARLEFAVLKTGGGVELVRRYTHAQQHRLGLTPLGPDGALVFEAAISDWSMALDSGAWQGRRVFKARLLDDQGRELQHSLHELIVDATPPEEVTFVAPPPQAQRGTTLKLVAHGIDRDSDIAQVNFFVGKPDGAQIPAKAPTFAGFAVDLDHGLWGGSVLLPPDHTGPLTLGVQFSNRAGLVRCATTTIELLDVDPATLRPGSIAGKVLEGPRPQPGLTVILRDEQGNDKSKTRTGPDGAFQFDVVPPGRYLLFSDKPESGRRVLQPIIVPAGGAQRVNLALTL